MDDLISRKSLLNALKELYDAWAKYPCMKNQMVGVKAAIAYVETIPTAEIEPKQPRERCAATISRQLGHGA